jgi:hypothetical protein
MHLKTVAVFSFKKTQQFQFQLTERLPSNLLLPRGNQQLGSAAAPCSPFVDSQAILAIPLLYISIPGALASFSPLLLTSRNPKSSKPPWRHCRRRALFRQAQRNLFASFGAPSIPDPKRPYFPLYLAAIEEIGDHLPQLRQTPARFPTIPVSLWSNHHVL